MFLSSDHVPAPVLPSLLSLPLPCPCPAPALLCSALLCPCPTLPCTCPVSVICPCPALPLPYSCPALILPLPCPCPALPCLCPPQMRLPCPVSVLCKCACPALSLPYFYPSLPRPYRALPCPALPCPCPAMVARVLSLPLSLPCITFSLRFFYDTFSVNQSYEELAELYIAKGKNGNIILAFVFCCLSDFCTYLICTCLRVCAIICSRNAYASVVMRVDMRVMPPPMLVVLCE